MQQLGMWCELFQVIRLQCLALMAPPYWFLEVT